MTGILIGVQQFGEADKFVEPDPLGAKILAKAIDGTPKVRVSEVIHSTFHKITAVAAPGPVPVSAATAGIAKAGVAV